MRYHGRINYVKCQEWGLNMAQGALFDLLNESSSWAKTHIIGDEVYYWVSRNKVLDELPVAYTKSDTVYRHLKSLAKKGLIFYRKEGVKDLVMLTEKGKSWNAKINSDLNPNGRKGSDLNPDKLGFESENTAENSDLFPTDKDTNHKTTNDKNTSEIVGSVEWMESKFEDFYSSYPHKKSKAQALRTWIKVFTGKGDHSKPKDVEVLLSQIMKSIEVQNPLILQTEPKYRKHPSSWLNAQSWLDEIASNELENKESNNANSQQHNSRINRETTAEYQQRLQQEFNSQFGE